MQYLLPSAGDTHGGELLRRLGMPTHRGIQVFSFMEYAAGCLMVLLASLSFTFHPNGWSILFIFSLSFATIPLLCVICISVAVKTKSPRVIPPVREPLPALLLPFTIRKAAIVLGVHWATLLVIEIGVGVWVLIWMSLDPRNSETWLWFCYVVYYTLAFFYHIVAIAFLVSCWENYRKLQRYAWKIEFV